MNNILSIAKGLLVLSLILTLQGCMSTSGGYDPNIKYDLVDGRIGIIIMHGKGGAPYGHNSSLVRALRSEGFRVIEPSMPWGGHRGTAKYSASLDNAFDAIEKNIQRLRNDGADTIFLIGHSMGAMAAFSYGAYRGGISGVIGIAPGHTTGSNFHFETIGKSLYKARNLVTAGKGDEKTWFQDYNSGGRRPTVNTTPEIYLSYFEPDGEANMRISLSKLNEIPVLWIASSQDPITRKGFAKRLFSNAASNDMNRFIIITSGHREAPSKSIKEVKTWIKTVVEEK